MKNLARIRDSRGLTQTQLAEMVGANQATISKIEKGVGNPTLSMILRIADALKCDPADLFRTSGLRLRVLAALEAIDDPVRAEAAPVVLESSEGEPNPMRTTQSLSITLPHEMAQMVKAKVASGEYATESEVIRDGLRSLAARDAAIEKWLQQEVAPTYDRVIADPVGNTLSAEDAHTRLQAQMDQAARNRGR